MTIHDRGLKKWNAASFMPEVFSMSRKMFRDTERIDKPILDVYQMEEFDQQIAYAMGENLPIILSVWKDGFIAEYTGYVHYVDWINHQLRIEVSKGVYERIAFEDVVGVVTLLSK